MYYISVTVGSNWAVITCSWVTKIGCLTVADICIQIHMNRVKGNSVVEILMGYAKHRIICVLGYFSFWLDFLQCQVVFDFDENETGENESSFPNVCVHSAPLHHTQIGRHFLYSVGIILILRDCPSHSQFRWVYPTPNFVQSMNFKRVDSPFFIPFFSSYCNHFSQI